jgi:hypothetical protein
MLNENIFNIFFKKSATEPNVCIYSFIINTIQIKTMDILNFAVLLFNFYNLKHCKGEFAIFIKTNLEDKKFIFCCNFDSKDFTKNALKLSNESYILLELNIYIKVNKILLESPQQIIQKVFNNTLSMKVYNSELLY